MTTMVGMDTEVVTDLAHGLLADADRMDDVAGQLRTVVGDLSTRSWSGSDCSDFSMSWQRVHDPALVALATRLRELGRLALVEVVEQERASGVAAPGRGAVSTIPSPVVPTAATGLLSPGSSEDRDLLALATAVYPGGSLAGADGRFRELTGDELRGLGISEQMLRDDGTGFAARIYRSEDGRTVLSFRGSDGIDVTDFVGSNIPNGIGLPTPQGGQAIAWHAGWPTASERRTSPSPVTPSAGTSPWPAPSRRVPGASPSTARGWATPTLPEHSSPGGATATSRGSSPS